MRKADRTGSFRAGLVLLLPALLWLCLAAAPALAQDVTSLDRARTHVQRGELDEAEKMLNLFIQENPDDPRAYFMKAGIMEKREDPSRAAALMLEAEKRDPDNVEYLEGLARLYFLVNRNEEALRYALLLQKKGESSAGTHLLLARVLHRLGRNDEALQAAMSAASHSPDDPECRITLGSILSARNDPAGAAAEYEKALAQGHGDKALLYTLAGAYEDAGNPDKAVETLRKILKRYPDDLKPLQSISRIYRQKGDLARSVEAWVSYQFGGLPAQSAISFLLGFGLFFMLFFKTFRLINSLFLLPLVLIAGGLGRADWLHSLSGLSMAYGVDHLTYLCNLEITLLNPRDSAAWKALAFYHEHRGNLGKARDLYRRVVELEPESGESWYALGTVLLRLDDFKQAELALKKALQLGEESFLTWYHLSLAFYRQEVFAEASEAARQSVELSPEFTPSLDLYVEASESLGQVEECEKFLLELSGRNPGSVKILIEVGNLLLSSGRAKDSIRYFEESAANSPDSHEAWYNLGVAQREAGLLDNAANSIKRALELSPESSWIHASYGLTQIMNNRRKEAEGILRQAVSLDPLSSYSHFLLGTLLAKKDPARAQKHFRKAVEYFQREMTSITKPWQKANEYECMALAYKASGNGAKAREALQLAVKYARITPGNIWIFSEQKMRLTPPGDFIRECQEKIETTEPEVSIGLSSDGKIP
jgi:tetratricopeptide (TPR) repeat protein